jgi:hypothetical protein
LSDNSVEQCLQVTVPSQLAAKLSKGARMMLEKKTDTEGDFTMSGLRYTVAVKTKVTNLICTRSVWLIQ